MKYTVLPGKLRKPELPDGYIVRHELLFGSSWANVILVCAQAGSGKSTAVSAWLSEQSRAYCWYSLDEWDNDPVQFLSYLVTALRPVDERAYCALEQLLEAYSTVGFDVFLRALIHQLHSIAVPFVLALDDYHLIRSEPIHQLIKTLIEHFPPAMQLCIITREDPPLPLARLRASRKLFELRIASLRFTDDQAKEYFFRQLGVTLEEEQLQNLIRRTEGWAAGLQMTALSMRGSSDIGRFVETFSASHYYVMDYLLEEVLDRQTPEAKAFLLSTSILETFSAGLCEEMLRFEAGASDAILLKLIRTNSFIIPLDSSRQWFRYHHLFRDLLRQRQEQRPQEETQALHLRAGLWFQKNGREQEAIYHLLKANAAEAAAVLIERRWAEMDVNVQSALWLDMAKKLPASIIDRSPVLAMGYGWALLDLGESETCKPWFQKARALYDRRLADPENSGVIVADELQFQLLPATIASAYGYIAAAVGDFEGTFTHTREALRLIPYEQHFKRGVVSILLGIAHWHKGDLREAVTVLSESLRSIRNLVTPFFENSYQLVLTELYIRQGELDRAKAQLEQTAARVIERREATIILASLYLGLAKIAFLRGDNAGAYQLLEQSKAHGQMSALMDWRYKYNLLLARIYCKEGLYDLARDCVREGIATFHFNPIPEDFTLEDAERLIEDAEKAHADNRGASAPHMRSFAREHANQALPEPLTVRELEVLELIMAGCSNEEVGNKLFLALSTVKSYNQHIFGKLQVNRRTQAAARAKELGLV